MDLTSKIALITGGIKGIGKATALTLASKGANIVLNYRKNSNNDEIALKLHSKGVHILPCEFSLKKLPEEFYYKCKE